MTDNPRALIPLDRAPFTFKTLQAVANTDFVPAGLRGKPNAILAAILTGRELGLGPMESLRSIDVIDGRPSPSAEWMVGRIFEAGHIIEAVEQTDQLCTVRGTRFLESRDVTMEYTYTLDMAKRANLTTKFNWKAYPEAMLYWRAVAQLARQFFPDVLRGIKHLPEELGADEWDSFGAIPEENDVDPSEGTIEIIEVIDAEVVVEMPGVWSPEPTGDADRKAIATVKVHANSDTLWEYLVHCLTTYEIWIEQTIPEIETQVRYLFRAMECLELWQGENVLSEELARQERQHLSEFKKAELQKFAKNMVTKATVAIQREGQL
jgi:hypothetical protein